jgi:hypothetical protein
MEEQGQAFALERNLDTTTWTPAQFESYAGMCFSISKDVYTCCSTTRF